MAQPANINVIKVPPDFKGNGTIKCHFCGEPVRDHRIGPCPKAGVTHFNVAASRAAVERRKYKR